MKRTFHRLRRRGPVDRRVSVRTQYPWYLKVFPLLLLLGLGYGIAYWQYVMPHAPGGALGDAYLAKLTLAERQLQIERATHSNAMKEMASLQDEIMRLKEDVAFYQGILSERGGPAAPHLESVKINQTRSGEYRYEINLAQSSAQGKAIQGNLRLTLQGVLSGKEVHQPIVMESGETSMMVNFKKFRRVEGLFAIPEKMQPQTLLVEFTEAGQTRPRLSQTFKLSE